MLHASGTPKASFRMRLATTESGDDETREQLRCEAIRRSRFCRCNQDLRYEKYFLWEQEKEKMYKVVIVDDEPLIVEGLTRIVPWAKYGCKVVGKAMDGREGLKVIRQLRPDIVFTDIYMPHMDGLLMISALKSEWEDLQIAILTGYRDFELAQKALNLGVSRFILKPSNLKDLEEAVRFMTDRISRNAGEKDTGKGNKESADQAHSSDAPEEAEAETQASEEAEQSKEASTTEANNFLVKSALAYMTENYEKKLTLTEVADQMYVSQWHLSKLLNQYTKKTFLDILNDIRISEAKKLMEDPSLRVGEIAKMVGFSDVTHFSRVFKRLEGVPPAAYRNQMNT